MSGRKRFFIEQLNYPKQCEVTLDGEEFVHAKTVQRVEEGTEIVLLDGSGNEYTAILSLVEKRSLTAHIVSAAAGEREPQTEMYLLCGALKGDKTELVVQKATELGVSKIGVFSSEYCAAFINDNKIERLNKVAREAAKQCMRSRAPEVVYFKDFASALNSAQGYKNKLFACEFAHNTQIDINSLSGSTAIVIGSEGGFSQNEANTASTSGFLDVTLGKRILRAETAAISLLSIVAFALGELK
ncbi:MAG: 16S rRNA (uracil(1498)-N(3))-methyltransferase [Clostridia bacterium]|nr:16S rRNA (uracil(1498)-N(3))-methyltransferase [Clostridia bacterium]